MAKSSGPSSAGLARLRARAHNVNKATGQRYRVTIGEYRGNVGYEITGGGRGIYGTHTHGNYSFTQKMLSDIARRR